MSESPKEEIKLNEKGAELLSQLLKSQFYFETFENKEKVVCHNCRNVADNMERMKSDPLYGAPMCSECRNKQVERLYQKFLKRKTATEKGTYKVTAEEARAIAKGYIPVRV